MDPMIVNALIIGGSSITAAGLSGLLTKRYVLRKSRRLDGQLVESRDELTAKSNQIRDLMDEVERLKDEVGKGKKNKMDTCSLFHATSHRLRDIEGIVTGTDFANSAAAQQCSFRVVSGLELVLGELVDYFEKNVIGETTAACIKIFGSAAEVGAVNAESETVTESEADSAEPLVLCFSRDPNSKRRRGGGEPAYKLTESTAFFDIFTKQLKFYSRSEDLETEFNNGTYRNPTPNFWRRYRSVLVVPVRTKIGTADGDSTFDVIGFLALDTPSAGTFRPRHSDEKAAGFEVAAATADLLYWPLKHLIKRTYTRQPSLYSEGGAVHVHR